MHKTSSVIYVNYNPQILKDALVQSSTLKTKSFEIDMLASVSENEDESSVSDVCFLEDADSYFDYVIFIGC